MIKTALCLAFFVLAAPLWAQNKIVMKIPGVDGDSKLDGYEKWIELDSLSVSVERELRDSGEKGGTEDINIGVGNLGTVNVTKEMDRASAKLFQFAINGNSLGVIEIHFLTSDRDGGKMVPYLIYKLDRGFVQSIGSSASADDRPTEEVAFYYNKIAFVFYPLDERLQRTQGQVMSWDNVKNTTWGDHGLETSPPK